MKYMEIGEGKVLVGTAESEMIGTIDPIPDGFWVSVGRPNEDGIIVDSKDWRSFVQLVYQIDTYIKEWHE